MEIQILNEHQFLVSPSNFTELYAVKQFIKENENLQLKDTVQINTEDLCQNENF
jgi:hypothetical protein